MDKAKKDLEALDKPELRHGDYGISSQGVGTIVMGNGTQAIDHRGDGATCDIGRRQGGKYATDSNSRLLGNIFDDLAAISEPLEEFETKDSDGLGNELYAGYSCKKTQIFFQVNEETHFYMNIDILPDFILNLRRMEATLKAREGK